MGKIIKTKKQKQKTYFIIVNTDLSDILTLRAIFHDKLIIGTIDL